MLTKKGHEDAAGRMLGPAVLKVRILRKLGYTVIWLPFNEVQQKAWHGKRDLRRKGADYLRDKILGHWRSEPDSHHTWT